MSLGYINFRVFLVGQKGSVSSLHAGLYLGRSMAFVKRGNREFKYAIRAGKLASLIRVELLVE